MAWTSLPETVEVTVETPKPQEFTLDPAKTAVVVVDIQNLSRFGRYGEIVEGNVSLLAKAREAGVKVLYVQSVRQPESPDHTLFHTPLHLQQGS